MAISFLTLPATGAKLVADPVTTYNGAADAGGASVQYAKFGWGAAGVLNDVSAATPMPVSVPDVTASAALTITQSVTLTLNGHSSAAFQITAIVGTVSFEASNDGGTTWDAVNGTASSTSTPATTTTVTGTYRLTPGGIGMVRARLSAGTSAMIFGRGSAGTGGIFANQILPTKNTDGTSTQAIKAASTAAVAADAAAVVALSPNSPTPAGTNVIGSLAANQTVNISQTNGVAPLMGNGVSGTGSQRINIASDNSALPAAGQGAVGSAVPAGATLHGLRAATANPTNTTAGNMVAGMADKAGRAVVAVGQVRELIGVQQTSVAVVTADQPIVAAGGAGVFNDISQLIITTAGAAAQTITIKDSAAGTTRLVLNYPNAASAPGAPMVINFNPPLPAAAANTAWVVTQSAATACNYTVVFAKNL